MHPARPRTQPPLFHRSAPSGGATGALVAAALVLGLRGTAYAQQTFPYVIFEQPRTYVALTGGTTLSYASSSTDDGGELVDIGFDFTYFGETYRFVNVGVNGHLTFAASCDANNPCQQGSCGASGVCEELFMSTSPPFGTPRLPNPAGVDGFVAPFWDDLILGASSSITVGTVGTSPRRELVVQWSSMERFLSSQSTADFQVRLEEGTNLVRIAYGRFGSASDNGVWRGLIGAESPSGTQGLTTLTCSATDSCTAQNLIDLADRSLEILLPNGAELTGSATAPTGGEVGDPLPVALTVSNIGTQTTTVGFEARVYFSSDATIERTDLELGVLSFPALLPGASSTQTLDALVPNLPIGVYAVGALVDTSSVVAESIETNNVVIAEPRFLIGSELGVSLSAPASGGIGDPLDVTVLVENDGSAQAAVGVDVYLSADAVLDASDRKIGTATTAVPAVPSTRVDIAGQVPPDLQEGAYRIIAVVDPGNRIAESDETNNVAVSSGSTSFVAADLWAPAIAVDRTIAFRGESIQVTTEIENEGGSTARGFTYEYYLSTNELVSRISDPFLGSAGPLTIAPGERETVTHTFTVSSTIAVDQYFVGVILNSNQRVPEPNINDNIRRTPTKVVIRDPGPDFAVAQVATPPGAAAGEPLLIERAIYNLGNAAGTTTYDVYLSEDDVVDPASDLRLLSGTSSIAVGGEDYGVDRVTLAPTVSPGTYHVLYRLDADDAADELDETNNDGGLEDPIMVAPALLAILTESLPFATVGVSYGVGLGAAGGAGAYVWSIADGVLPEGIALDPTGRLAGIPTREGVASFTLAVSDGQITVARPFTILVAEASEEPEVLTRTLPLAFENRPYEATLTVYGGVPPYTWEVRGNLPTGITMDANGRIGGTPTTVDLRMFSVLARDSLGVTADRILVLRVVRPSTSVRFTSMALPDGRIGEPYEATLEVEDGTGEAPFTFALTDGDLPPGLALSDGTISGTPTRAGVFDATFRVVDDLGDADLNRFVIEISESSGVRFLTASLPEGEIGSAYLEEDGDPIRLRAISEQGSDEVEFELVGGALPSGLVLELDGTVTGTPARTGVFDFVVRAEDPAGQTSLRAFAVLVNEPPAPAMPKQPENGGCACVTPSPDGVGARLLGWGLILVGALGLALRRRGIGASAALIALLGTGSPAEAQTVFDYVVTQRNATYVPRTTGANQLQFSSRDDGSATITLPFPFRFYGADHATVSVSTNGYVVFPGGGAATEFVNQLLPLSTSPNNLIAPWWDDLESPGEAWFVEGTAPDRRVVIQFSNANRLGQSTAGRPQFQLHLFEGRSRFEVHYGGVANAGGTAFWSASAGLEDAAGIRGQSFFACGANCGRDDFPSGLVVFAQEDGGTDVVARSVLAPPVAFPGSPVDLVLEVGSVHANPLGPFDWAVYLVPASETEPSGAPLETGTLSLQPFGDRELETRVLVPPGTPLGRYRFVLEVDASRAITEPDEANNQASSGFVRVDSPRPDLAVASVRSPDPRAEPGGPLQVDFELRNEGAVAADAAWHVVVSRNAVVTTGDRVIDAGMEALPGLGTSSVSRALTLPTDLVPGAYTLGVVVDPEDQIVEGREVNNTGTAPDPILIAGSGLAIEEMVLPAPFLGVPYTVFLTPVGGDGTYEWSVADGQLPRGLFLLPSTGELRGTPIEPGVSSPTIEVRSGSEVARRAYELAVERPVGGFLISTRQLLPGVVGRDYPGAAEGGEPQRLRSIGGTGEVTYSLDSPAPPGLELAPAGVISGIPIQAGRFSIDVRATDAMGAEAIRTLFLTVAEPGRITLVADPLPDGEVGRPYAVQLRSIGASPTSTPTYGSMGPLPPGLVVGTSGALAGTPRAVGTFTFPVTVSEGDAGQSDSALFRLRVGVDDGLTFRAEGARTATVGEPVDVTLTAVGGSPPYDWRGFEELPDGLKVDIEGLESNVLRITGTLATPGVATFLAILGDADRRVYREPVTFRFLPEPPAPAPEGSDGCRVATGAPRSTASAVGGVFLLVGLLAIRRRR